MPDGTDWFLPNRRGRSQYHNVDRWWHLVCENVAERVTDPVRAQLLRTKLDIHFLRYTFSTVGQELGAALAKIQKQFGDASVTMTRHTRTRRRNLSALPLRCFRPQTAA